MKPIFTISALAFLFVVAPSPCLVAPLGLAADEPQRAEPVPTDAAQGIVKLFEKYSVVGLGEGTHGCRQYGEFYVRLVRDAKFQAAVNDIVVEFASRHSQPLLDRYLLKCEDLPRAELSKIWRDYYKVSPFGECPVYTDWLAAIRQVNQNLPENKRLRVLAGDWAIDWSKIKTRADFQALGSNNLSFAQVVNEEVLAKKRKCLLVLGTTHIFKNGDNRPKGAGGELGIPGNHNAATLIEKANPGSIVVILPFHGGLVQDFKNLAPKLADWKKPSLLFPLKDSWLGAERGNGRPADRLDRLGDALLYLGPSFTAVPPLPEKIDRAYYDELQRRAMIRWGHTRFVEGISHDEK